MLCLVARESRAPPPTDDPSFMCFRCSLPVSVVDLSYAELSLFIRKLKRGLQVERLTARHGLQSTVVRMLPNNSGVTWTNGPHKFSLCFGGLKLVEALMDPATGEPMQGSFGTCVLPNTIETPLFPKI